MPDYSEEEVYGQLVAYVEEAGTQVEAAKQLGISNAYMNDVIHKRRGISAEVAEKLGFTKRVIFTQGDQS